MNVKIFILFLFIGFYPSAYCQKQNDPICLIKQAYDRKNYHQFFRLFPNPFPTFIEYYGYINDKPAPLYFVAYEHLEYLMSGEVDAKLINKIFCIAKDGIWNADAPSYLQEHLQQLILEYPNIFLREFEKHSNNAIQGFWYFVLYNLHPEQENYQKMYLQLRKSMSMNKNIITLIDLVYRDILSMNRG